MARRSSRLVSGGYYNSDEESDSSSVTNISYRENPVKVFKKKAGTRKGATRTPNKGKTSASTGSPEQSITAGQYEGLTSSPSVTPSQTTMGTTPYSTVATPRPALTPTRCPTTPAERSPLAGPRLYKELSQCGVDSSGYSSSEGPLRKPIVTSSPNRTSNTTGGAPSTGYRISSTFFDVIDSISVAATAVKSEVMRQATLANTSVGSRTKKACGLLLLLLLILLCIWFFFPWLTSLISRFTVTKTLSQSPPVAPVAPLPQLNTMHPAPVVDPVVVSAVVEAKLQRVTEQLQMKLQELQMKQQELQLKQEHIFSQMNERLQLDVQDMKTQLEVVDSDSRQHLQQELAGLSQQLLDLKTDSRSTVDSLSLRIQAVVAQNAKLSQEWSSFQALPPPAPCPDQSSSPVLTELTPELQQAMERWLTDRIKEQDALRLTERGGCSDCQRPMADKMADFALETQGASVISTRCSETYRIRSACVTLFGFPLWYPSESPRTVIQGFPVLLPGKCWAFHGVQGTLVIALSHPITITHVTLDHLPRYNSPTGRIDSAPKNFEVYGMKNDTEEGTLLGTFTYNEQGESSQTFKLPNPSEVVYRVVELRVLSNWGHVEYTCLYRFRVHGQMAST